MADYIETQTKDGATIRVEVDFASKAGAGFGQSTASGEEAKEAAKNAYEDTLGTIRACANGVIDTLQNLDTLPSAASINFAIKIDAEAGAMVAKSMNDGHFKVALSWKQVESGPEEEKKDE